MASNPAITIMSEDPEVMALQAMIRGLNHFENKNLTPLHFRVLMAVELCIKGTKTQPTKRMIATFAQLQEDDFEDELEELVARRYLVTEINKYGPLDIRYKLGAMGGTALRHMLDRKKKKKADSDAIRLVD